MPQARSPGAGHRPPFRRHGIPPAPFPGLRGKLDAIFAAHDFGHWRRALTGFAGEWAPVQTPAEVHDDPQVRANGYIAQADMGNGVSLPLVTSSVQFDGQPGQSRRAPEHGEHTEAVLLELGMTWDEIGELKDQGAII